MAPPEPPPPGAWWGAMFVRAGRMGSIRSELKSRKPGAAAGTAGASGTLGADGKRKIQVSGFLEEDQEQLYEQVCGWAVGQLRRLVPGAAGGVVVWSARRARCWACEGVFLSGSRCGRCGR
jgi:hypothetical protein